MNTGILYVRMGVTVLISLYTTRVILNALGAGDFGLFNVVGGAIAMLTFLNGSMTAATQRFMSFAQGEGDAIKQQSIFNVSMILHGGVAIAVLLLLEGVGWVLFHSVFRIAPDRIHAAWMVYQFAAISTLFTIVAVPYEAVITAHENMLFFAVLGVIEAVLKLGIALFIVHTGWDKLVFYSFWMAIISVLMMAARALYCHGRYAECRLHPVRGFQKTLFLEMSGFAGWSLFGSATSMIANYGQGIVVNTFFGTVVNAAQGVASQVSGQLSAFAGTMLRALNPLIAKSEGAGDRQAMLRATMMGSKTGFFLLMLFYVPVLVRMPQIFELWLEKPPEFAVLFCRLLLVRNLIEQFFVPLVSSIAAVGNIRKYQIWAGILNIVPLSLAYVLFKFGFEAYWIYVSFLIYTVLNFWMTMRFANRLCSLPVGYFLVEVVLRCTAALLLVLMATIGVDRFVELNLSGLLYVLLVSLATFLLCVPFVGMSRSERSEVVRLIEAAAHKFKIRARFERNVS